MTLEPTAPDRRTVRLRTASTHATRALGAALATVARPGDRIALLGPLGAGKTQLAKGFAAGLGVTDEVTSPTFTLMAEYAGRLPLFHVDLYRLTDTEDVLAGGLLDEREDHGVTLTEWADRLDAALDADRLTIRIAPDVGSTRHLELAAPAGRYGAYLDVARAWAATAEPAAQGGPREHGGTHEQTPGGEDDPRRVEASPGPEGRAGPAPLVHARADTGRRTRAGTEAPAVRSALLVIDTATSHTVVALRAAPGGPPHDGSSAGGERSGASLGSRLAALLTRTGLGPRDLAAVGVGTGPGSFTGLRVGLATGKALAWSLSIPLVGIPTAEALRRAAGIATGADAATLAVLQPAGARDHYLALPGEPPRLAPPGTDLAGALLGHALVAVDVEAGRVAGCRGPLGLDPVDAGAAARERLGDALLGLLEERLAAGATDDPAALVPVYVALPKGASGPAAVATGSAWTPDLR